jgi:hypothetical protein
VTIGGIDGTPSPNGGQVFNIGALGFNPGTQIGFDIAADGTAYAAFRPNNGKGAEVLYTVDLATGQATPVGKVGNGKLTLDGLTALSREEIVFGVTVSNRLVSFRADNPGTLLSSVAIQGLIVGEKVTDIDFRPASGELFALSSINRVLRPPSWACQSSPLRNSPPIRPAAWISIPRWTCSAWSTLPTTTCASIR